MNNSAVWNAPRMYWNDFENINWYNANEWINYIANRHLFLNYGSSNKQSFRSTMRSNHTCWCSRADLALRWQKMFSGPPGDHAILWIWIHMQRAVCAWSIHSSTFSHDPRERWWIYVNLNALQWYISYHLYIARNHFKILKTQIDWRISIQVSQTIPAPWNTRAKKGGNSGRYFV